MRKYKIVIHTDKYAGNFERELTAYLVGQIGDCEVGLDYIQGSYPEDFEFIVEQRSDENGIRRPCGICPIDNSLLGDDEVKLIWLKTISSNITTYEGYIASKLSLLRRAESGEVLLGGWNVDNLNAEITRNREYIEMFNNVVYDPNMILNFAVEIYFTRKLIDDELISIKNRLKTFKDFYRRDTPKFLRMDVVEEVYTENILESIMIGN